MVVHAYDPLSERVGQEYARRSRSFSDFEARLGHRRGLSQKEKKEKRAMGVVGGWGVVMGGLASK